jgi:hypothetical protein
VKPELRYIDSEHLPQGVVRATCFPVGRRN